MNAISFSKIRIAPTPSGYLHIGNAISFIITAFLVKEAKAKLLLRIDDLDRERTQKRYVEDIFETLDFLGIQWDEGPKDYDEYEQTYSQIHRMHLYERALEQLRNENKVYACTCSRLQAASAQVCFCPKNNISLDTPNVSWRSITDSSQPLTIKGVKTKVNATLPLSMQNFIVRKKNGLPSYQLTSLIDDEFFGMDAIVRGEDLWDSTLAQQYLALQLGKPFFKDVLFYHHPLLMEKDGAHKLSKSAGAYSIKHLRAEGKTKEHVLGMIEQHMEKLGIEGCSVV